MERHRDFEIALFNAYERYKERSLKDRFFKHADIISVVERHKDRFSVAELGKSVQNRSIQIVKLGDGKTKVLLWSQMHGDEPTATMALADIFNFFSVDDEFTATKDDLLEHLTIYIIPMLNPDGAEVYSRRNALGIDLNRDAIRLSSPEAKIFKRIFEELKPDFAFNLHDQNPRYTVGNSSDQAAISFLAPVFDYERSENENRRRAMKLISLLNEKLQIFIPGLVGKYFDEFAPRAFGDNAQKWGASTILVESGGYEKDIEKQFIRKLNFVLLLSAFKAISSGEYQKMSLSSYYDIPLNTYNFYDFIIRNASIEVEGERYQADIGINRYELPLGGCVYIKSKIDEVGDLSFARGGDEFDASGLVIKSGGCFPKKLSLQDLTIEKAYKILRSGCAFVPIEEEITEEKPSFLPVNLTNRKIQSTAISIDTGANLMLSKDREIKYAILNGQLIDLSKASGLNEKNGLFLV